MGRHKTPEPEKLPDNFNRDAVVEDTRALDAVSARSREIAERFGDGQAYDRSRIVSEARFFMGAAAEAMLELGKRLVQIKENEPHGDFVEIVEHRLGIGMRSAQRAMSAAVKYLSPALGAKATTFALLGKAKLLDLVSESDEDLEELAEGGTLAGLTLDEIQAMSVRELREALAEERKKVAAKDKVIAGKETKISQLEEKLETRRSADPDERAAEQLRDMEDALQAAELTMVGLIVVVDQVIAAPATPSTELKARQVLDYFVARLEEEAYKRGLALSFDSEEAAARIQQWRDRVAEIQAGGGGGTRGGGKGRGGKGSGA
jgi:hypothetical protein